MDEEFIYQEVETEAARRHALDPNPMQVETDFQFKAYLMQSEAKSVLGDLLDLKEFKLANLTAKSARKVGDLLDLASDLIGLGLEDSAKLFISEALQICNISRSIEMKQQDKFVEHRDIRVSSLQGLKEKRTLFGRRRM